MDLIAGGVFNRIVSPRLPNWTLFPDNTKMRDSPASNKPESVSVLPFRSTMLHRSRFTAEEVVLPMTTASLPASLAKGLMTDRPIKHSRAPAKPRYWHRQPKFAGVASYRYLHA